jgi:hypothetical protein
MDFNSMMNAMANTLRAELDNSMDFIRENDRVVGIWVARFPTNTSERDFLTAYCNKERARGLLPEAVADSLVDKIYDSKYKKTQNTSKGGFDILF